MKARDGTKIQIGHVFQSDLWPKEGKKVVCITVEEHSIVLKGEPEDELPFTLTEEQFKNSRWIITDFRNPENRSKN